MSAGGFHCPGCGHHFIVPDRRIAGVTRLQTRVMAVICERAIRGELPPTQQEISHAIGRTHRAGISEPLERLIENGFLTRIPRRSRSWVVTDKGWALYGVRLEGGDDAP